MKNLDGSLKKQIVC